MGCRLFCNKYIGVLFTFSLIVSSSFANSLTWPIKIIDDDGVEHSFDEPVRRIVSLMPNSTELLFEINAGDLLVGAVEYSNYPEAAKRIPRVGGYGALNIEAIIALKPDVLIAWPASNRNRELDRLRELGMRVFVSDPQEFADIADSIIAYGQLTGHTQEAQKQQLAFNKTLLFLKNTYSQREKVSVFYQVWNAPLMTQNGSTFIGRAIELCGGENIFSDLPMANPQVNIESILVKNPQVIVVSGMGESRPEWLDDWNQYSTIDAVKNQHLYHILPDLFQRQTSRFLIATQQLCEMVQQAR